MGRGLQQEEMMVLCMYGRLCDNKLHEALECEGQEQGIKGDVP